MRYNESCHQGEQHLEQRNGTGPVDEGVEHWWFTLAWIFKHTACACHIGSGYERADWCSDASHAFGRVRLLSVSKLMTIVQYSFTNARTMRTYLQMVCYQPMCSSTAFTKSGVPAAKAVYMVLAANSDACTQQLKFRACMNQMWDWIN